jgi:hypothetical protein
MVNKQIWSKMISQKMELTQTSLGAIRSPKALEVRHLSRNTPQQILSSVGATHSLDDAAPTELGFLWRVLATKISRRWR